MHNTRNQQLFILHIERKNLLVKPVREKTSSQYPGLVDEA